MPRALLISAILFCLPVPVSAQGIYRCTSPGTVGYQDTPCAAGQTATPLPLARTPSRTRYESEPLADEQCASRRGGRAALPFRPTVLCLGMSDDEVLNLPRWGRPTRITRMKTHRAWREQWEYRTPANTSRRLYFVNGRLTTIEGDVDAPPTLAAP